MRDEQDGRGEGYGRYQGLPVSEIQALFEKCVQEPTMRSISAILRITREQLDARGQLGVYPVLTWIAVGICGLSLIGRFALPASVREMATKAAMGAGCVSVLLLLSTIPAMRTRKRNLAQEAAIRRAAAKAISEILESEPMLKPLTFEQEFTVKLFLKDDPQNQVLRRLL